MFRVTRKFYVVGVGSMSNIVLLDYNYCTFMNVIERSLSVVDNCTSM